jgi:hypothetical protein
MGVIIPCHNSGHKIGIQLTEAKWGEKRKKKGGIAKGKGIAMEIVNFVYFCWYGAEVGGHRGPQACSVGTDAVLMGGITHTASWVELPIWPH